MKSSDEPCCSKTEDTKENENSKENEDPWLLGLARNAVLHIKYSALEESPENPPAHRLHMTYKTHQAETKLLNALLTAHGLREVSCSFPFSCLVVVVYTVELGLKSPIILAVKMVFGEFISICNFC